MRLLLVDDHGLFRDGLSLLLAEWRGDVQFVHASSAAEALQCLASQAIDLVLLDLHLPDLSKLELLQRIREAAEGTGVVVLSGDEDPQLIRACVEEGALGYIPKASSPATLRAALQLVLAGEVYLPPRLLGSAARMPQTQDPAGSLRISPRQAEIVRKAIQGKSNKIIARELDIAEATVKAHLSAAYRVLGVRNRTEAVYAAARGGLRGTLDAITER